MKKVFFLLIFLSIVLGSCNNISNKPVSEKLTTEELSKAIKSDTSFSEFYKNLQNQVEEMDDIKKAKYNDVTYRRIFNYFLYLNDTAYWNPLYDKWGKEWNKEYGIYIPKADSVINHWKKYLADNSLEKYVHIELAEIDKDYYDYIGELKEVRLGFKLTPLQGAIEQVRFNYGYKVKINEDNKYYEKNNCMLTTPFSSPVIKYWKVGYSDKENFAGKTVETFLRDYSIYIEVTNIRINGKNIGIDDFSIPEEITECLENEKDYPSLVDYYKGKVIKKLINNSYVQLWEFRGIKARELMEKKDKLCYDFYEELTE